MYAFCMISAIISISDKWKYRKIMYIISMIDDGQRVIWRLGVTIRSTESESPEDIRYILLYKF